MRLLEALQQISVIRADRCGTGGPIRGTVIPFRLAVLM